MKKLLLALLLLATPAHAITPPDDGTAERLRKLGFHCPKVVDLTRTEVDHRGNKIYKLSCGYSGPHYRVTITPQGRQHVQPWN